jgi:1-acyl-sn-glycerol-3-phosphate acyltransferase
MLQQLFNDFLNRCVKMALWFYFSEIKVIGDWKAYRNKPVLLLANHQNALLDALLIATQIGLRPYFLARASVFKHTVIAGVLGFIRMVPVYRIRDGFRSLSGNRSSFSFCESVLINRGKILLFPEGNHSLMRRIRPLSKGFTRIVNGALSIDQSMDLIILPVGINYQAHQKSGSRVVLEIGAPIAAKEYKHRDKALLKIVEETLKNLTLHLPEANYDDLVKTILQSDKDITLSRGEIEHSDLPSGINRSNKPYSSLRNKLFKASHLPIWLIWKTVQPRIKDPVFYGTIKFCLGLVFVPLYYLLTFGLLYHFIGVKIALSGTLVLLLILKINRNKINYHEWQLFRK